MADDKAPAAAKAVTFEDAMAAYGDVEKAVLKALAVTDSLVHDEASSLRGLFTETLGVLRAGKPQVKA